MPRKKKTEKIEEKTKENTEKEEEMEEEIKEEIKENKSDSRKDSKKESGENKEEIEKFEKLNLEAKKEIIEEKPKQKLLVPLEDYIGCSVHIGTSVITPSMKQFVFRRKADGLAVIDTNKIDDYIKKAAEFISKFSAEDIIVVCKREAGWRAVENFGKVTGIRVFIRTYPAGIITNPTLENFFEPKLVIIVDPWLDKNALQDAIRMNIPVVSLCDTNNNTENINVIIPCNNKTSKSIGLVFYVLAMLYCKKHGEKTKLKKEDFYNIEKVEKEGENKN